MLRIGTAIILVLLGSYGIYKAFPLIAGPEIVLTSPQEGQAFTDGFVTLSGTARHSEELSLNGAPLLIDAAGRFETILVLPRGGAILSLTATDRFGKTASARRMIFVP